MKKKLAIIGASYLQAPLVFRAKAMGVETHCFAWLKDAFCKDHADYFYPISILDKEEIFKKCFDLKIDGITSIATDMAVPTMSYVGQKMKLISNSNYSAERSTNKLLMRKTFQEHNVPSPLFVELEDGLVSVEKVGEKLKFPMIVKPVDRSGSNGVRKVNEDSELNEAVSQAIEVSFSNQCIVEEYIEGDEYSVETISWKGNHQLLAITEKVTTGVPNFVEIAHHQPAILPSSLFENIKNLTFQALTALDIQFGAAHTEIKVNYNEEVYFIEVGARMGGDFIGSDLVSISTEYDYVKGVIDIALNQFDQDVHLVNKNYCGVYFLSQETGHLKPFFEKKNSFDYRKEILNDDLKKLTSSNDRSGYLIYKLDKKLNLL